MGWPSVRAILKTPRLATPKPSSCGGSEALGKVCGVPRAKRQGEKLDPTPVHRCVVNVGTALESPSCEKEALAKGRSIVI